MHVTLLTHGTRGDVQPFLALGTALQQVGYQVRLAAPSLYESWITSYGLEFAPLAGNPQVNIRTPSGQALIQSGDNAIAFLWHWNQLMIPLFEAMVEDSWNACQDTDAVIATNLIFWGLDIAEFLSIPCIFANLNPVMPTYEFPVTALSPNLHLPAWANRLSYPVSFIPFWNLYRRRHNRWRKSLNLPPLGVTETPISRMAQSKHLSLYGYSPTVLPQPKDWPDYHRVTGYWVLDRAESPSTELQAFLEAGPPPILIGFGSMVNPARSPAVTECVITALHQTSQRGILSTGWGGLQASDLPDTILQIDSAPYEWLLPQLRGLIHHGGVGTTGAGLRAGIPSMAVPFFSDQPFWGDRLHWLGVGPKPIAQSHLTVDTLTAAIRQLVNTPRYRDRAAKIGQCLQAEDGLAEAIRWIDAVLRP